MLNVSTNNIVYKPNTPNIYAPFKIPVNIVSKNLVNAADGMIPYDASSPPSWQNFPQRNSYIDSAGFKQDLTLNGGHTFNKVVGDNGIDYREKNLAATQLAYDAQNIYPSGTPENTAVRHALNLLSSIFLGPLYEMYAGRIRPEFDVNQNGIFDAQDATTLATLDGDQLTLSSADLDIASSNQVM